MAMFLDQPFKRAATNVSSEPLVTDAADCIDVCKVRKTDFEAAIAIRFGH